MVKRKSEYKQPTARKSTRNRLILNRIIMSQADDNENQLNYQAEMTDDETESDTISQSSPDTESQESTKTRSTLNKSSTAVASTSTENRPKRSTRSASKKSKTVTINEPNISSQEENNQTLRTINTSQHSDFIISIESQEYFTPPSSENLISKNNQMYNISDGDLELEIDNIQLNNNELETGWISDGSVHAFKYKFKVDKTTTNKIASFDLDGMNFNFLILN